MDACAAAAGDEQLPVAAAAAADPRHMLSYVHPDNFESLAVAAEVIALEKKKLD